MARTKKATAKKGTAKKSTAGSNDQLKKVKAQLAELKKKSAQEKKELTARLKDQKTELTAKMNEAVASAFAAGFDKALTEAKKLSSAREKALSVAAKKFDSKNTLKAPVVKKAKKTKIKAKKASSKRGRPGKKATLKVESTMSPASDSSMAA